MKYKKIEATVSGLVQGVGFRFFVEMTAQSLGITGWVCNLPDGNVKTVGVGTEEQVAGFLEKLKEGPSMSRVDNVIYNIQDVEFNEYVSFDISYY
jgi:acylphosphatase